MEQIVLSRLRHNNEDNVKIGFSYNFKTKEYIKKFDSVKWSATHKSFYFRFSKPVVNQFYKHLKARNYTVDYSPLVKGITTNKTKNAKDLRLEPLDFSYIKDIKKFVVWMHQKRYSFNTINTYESMLITFFKYHHPKKINLITKEDLIDFNTNYILKNKFSHTYQNQIVNAVKLFYRQNLNLLLDTETLERPIKEKRLPEILSLNEVKTILYSLKNVKHRTLLSLLYSCGLRIGEALNLKLNDIDSRRKLIHIKAGKGKKDRYVPLSVTMIKLIRSYYFIYKPKIYLFEGQYSDQYSAVSARQVLKRALKQTNIKKRVTLHTLRHSYATHILENGTDIRLIQELLGHGSPKTTMIYTHISTTSLEKIKNPFDDFEI